MLAEGGLFTQTGGSGDAGNLKIDTGRLIVRDGSPVFTGTLGQGRGGDLTVTSLESVEVVGIDTDGIPSGLVTLTIGSGDAGDLTIDTRRLTVKDGGLLSAQTAGTGKAGMLNIDATDSAEITGTGGLLVSGINGGTAGSLTLETGELTIADGASVTVSSPEGLAGNLNIKADSLSQNRGFITAETGVSDQDIGANINLEISDIWRIENESLVSASAFGIADGGNINIDTEFIVAFPNQNNDITANAFEGDGGKITINAKGIFGIESRDEETPLSDITASSEFGRQGEVEINTSEIDPTRGLSKLPQETVEVEVAQGCQTTGGQSTLEFFAIGRGGLPPSPDDLFSSEIVIAEWIPLEFADEKVQEQTLEGSFTEDEIKNMTLLTAFPCQK